MLKNSSIKARLVLLICLLSLTMMGVGLLGLRSLASVNASLKTVYDDRLVALGFLDKVARFDLQGQLGIAMTLNVDPADGTHDLAKAGKTFGDADEAWSAYMATYLTPDETRLADQFIEQRKRFFDESVKPLLADLHAGDTPSAARLANGAMKELYPPVAATLNALVALQLDVAKSEYENAQASYRTVRVMTISTIVFGLLLAILSGRWMIRSISEPLVEAIGLADFIASGDLTHVFLPDADNETGRLMLALKNMNESLVGIVTEVRAGTQSIVIASGQIAAGNLDLSARTEQQAASLEETAASTNELTSTVRQNLENARQANSLSNNAVDTVERGSTAVEQLLTTVNEISESSSRIAEIIALIDGIAFQTNILALNAAVEAARAGDQGRGFAVVASEVRSLAQRSSAAAKEIKGLIEASVSTVREGVTEANEVGRDMVAVKQAIRRVAELVDAIATASEEQSLGIEQVGAAVGQMNQVTQQNAALVEEAAAASQSMDDQASKLQRAAAVFKLPGTQKGDAGTAVRRPVAKTESFRMTRSITPSDHATKSRTPSVPAKAKRLAATTGDAGWETF
ncbi:methyl-accepting chemotaxis protein [Paraburkholderia phenazinium]|uniref:methyl-accepting chemotaxis protein n=1 Tax=Paraburkholderia phenazinium TaxID=60549 RepID=UPI00158F0B64|nr:methyl-accepting chemotaxis protein [Paraburkholderia phenazinium]